MGVMKFENNPSQGPTSNQPPAGLQPRAKQARALAKRAANHHDTAVSKRACLDSARAYKKPGGPCFDFGY